MEKGKLALCAIKKNMKAQKATNAIEMSEMSIRNLRASARG